MRCRTAERRLTPYLDGRLAPEASLELEAHLSLCQGCQETRAILEASRALLRAEGPGEPSAGLGSRAASQALAAAPGERPEGQSDSWLRLLAWPTLAPTGAAAALAVVLFVNAPPAEGPMRPSDAGAAIAQMVGPEELRIDPVEEGARMLGQEEE